MARKKERTGVVFLSDHMKLAYRLVPPEEIGALYEALRAYAMEGQPPAFEGRSENYQAVFEMMASAQDEYRQRYEETCERNRAFANKRWHAQASDGTPPQQKASGSMQAQTRESAPVRVQPREYGDMPNAYRGVLDDLFEAEETEEDEEDFEDDEDEMEDDGDADACARNQEDGDACEDMPEDAPDANQINSNLKKGKENNSDMVVGGASPPGQYRTVQDCISYMIAKGKLPAGRYD